MKQDKKFISPGAWFTMQYPSDWNEFEDAENSFLFYNPNKWTGNFRISAYKDNKTQTRTFGEKFLQSELSENKSACLLKVGSLDCAYSKEMFQEEGEYYVNHRWITGIGNVGFECTFTVPRGGQIEEAERVIDSLEIRNEEQKYPAEMIPVRVLEVCDINDSYEWVSTTVKNLFKKDFQGIEDDLLKLQQLIECGKFTAKQKDVWIAVGITACVILANELEGMEWMTLIDGNRETPILIYKDTKLTIDPMALVWSKIKRGQPCDIVAEYKQIIEKL